MCVCLAPGSATGDCQSACTINMLRAIIFAFLILWLLGVVLHIAGSLIHLLVLVALVLFIVDLMGRRRARV